MCLATPLLFMCVRFGVSFLAALPGSEEIVISLRLDPWLYVCVCVWCTQLSFLPEWGKVLF